MFSGVVKVVRVAIWPCTIEPTELILTCAIGRLRPERLATNVACLDYSVAKGGMLCAYRWDGESEIDNEEVTEPKEEVRFSGVYFLTLFRQSVYAHRLRRPPSLCCIKIR